METCDHPTLFKNADKQTSFADLIGEVEENCRKCSSLTPITCLAGCRTWKLKNQFRNLYKVAKDPGFMNRLLNTLKNKRRLQLFEIIAKGRCSTARLQHELKTLGFTQTQQTIVEEYVNPLIKVGLIQEDQNAYCTTMFGCRLSELTKGFNDLGNLLPPHSECYEEATLDVLTGGPKTREELQRTLPENSVTRILSRLQEAKLVEKSLERDHTFFFTTKRDPTLEEHSPTEKRVYDNINSDGISARKLAQETAISLRRTYRYLRKLKGKKLIFARKKPVSYWLTSKGTQVTKMIHAMCDLAIEVLQTAALLAEEKQVARQFLHEVYAAGSKSKHEEMIPSTSTPHLKNN